MKAFILALSVYCADVLLIIQNIIRTFHNEICVPAVYMRTVVEHLEH
jgi:hypothetical protein